MIAKTLFTLTFLSISFFALCQQAFDSLIIGKTKHLLPNDIVSYTFNYCEQNTTINPYEVFEILTGLKSYLNEHHNLKLWPSYYYYVANFYLCINKTDSASNYFSKTLTTTNNLPNELHFKALLAQAEILLQNGKLIESVNMLNNVKDKIQKDNSPEFLGMLFNQFAINNTYEENYSLASTQFQKAINYYKEINDTVKIAQTYTNLAEMYTKLGNYPMAIDFYQKSENIYRQTAHKWLLATNQLALGAIHLNASNLHSALRFLISAELLFNQLRGNEKLVVVYQIKGKTYTALRNFEQAQVYLTKAINKCKNIKHELYAELLYDHGNVYYKQELYTKAQNYYLQSLNSTVLPANKLTLYEKLSDVNSKLGNYRKAYKYQVMYNGLQQNILNNEIKSTKDRLNREFERQFLNNESEKSVLQKELSILTYSKQKRNNIYQLSIAILLTIALTLLFFLLKKRKSNINLHNKLQATIKLQRDELSKNSKKIDRISKSSKRILELSTKNIWEPFWVLENITNEIVDREFDNIAKSGNKAFDYDQLIMARNLLENILYWSMNQQKQIEFQPNSYNIEQILKPIIQTQTLRAKAKQISLNYMQSEKSELYVDKQTIQVALRNIIENAIKFSTLNGSISVSSKQSGNFIEIIIHDDGVGMTKEQIKSLFSKKKQHMASGTHGEKGMGLGLNLAKGFIETNFGKLHIDSSVAFGTSVSVLLPNKSPLKTT